MEGSACVEWVNPVERPPCVEKSWSVDCRGDPVICVERTHALPGTAVCREIVVAEVTLLFVWNARTHCQGPPCGEKSLSVDCRDDPVICVERTHALPGTALCREIVVGRLQRRPFYLCGTHARIARGYPVQRNCCRSTAEATLLFVWNARTHCQGLPCVEKLLSQRRPCYLCGTHARNARGHLV